MIISKCSSVIVEDQTVEVFDISENFSQIANVSAACLPFFVPSLVVCVQYKFITIHRVVTMF